MNTLKEMRINNGLTCQVMADSLHISKSFYWQLENNTRKLSYEMAVKIANILKTTPDKIFYDDYKELIKDFS